MFFSVQPKDDNIAANEGVKNHFRMPLVLCKTMNYMVTARNLSSARHALDIREEL